MEIKISKQPKSSITKNLSIPIELNNYTILAGENNAGKTNIVNTIKNHEDIKEAYEIIHIPAEKNNPQKEETSSSAKSTPFYKIIEKILDPIFKTEIINSLIDNFNDSNIKKDFVRAINNSLKNFGVNKKEFDIKITKEKFKEDIIIKIAKAVVKDLYKTDIDEVDLENIGMGTQRLIITALIQYYEENRIGADKKTIFIIEEPEIYLHPKWKKGLHESLIKLSENPNTKVLITTHDPYFIELGNKQNVYKVFREPSEDSTDIKKIEKDLLGYESDAEKNYLIFDLPSKTYYLELYEHLFSFFKDNNEKCKGCGRSDEDGENKCEGCGKPTISRYTLLNIWVKEQKDEGLVDVDFIEESNPEKNNPKISNTRQKIVHDTNFEIREEDLRKRIKELRNLLFIKKEE